MPYVKNADLTIEYIILHAFRVGAKEIYTDIRPGHQRAIVMVWPSETQAFPLGEYEIGYHRYAGFEKNLTSFRRQVDNQAFYERIRANGVAK